MKTRGVLLVMLCVALLLDAGCKRQSGNGGSFFPASKIDATVDIYTMGKAEGADTIFRSEPAVDVKPIQLGDAARLSSQSLVFRKEAFLVRIVAFEESAETQQALLQLGRGIERRLAR